MSDVERVIKFGEFLRAHPALETFLCGFLCGTLAAIVIHLVLYFFAKKCSKKEYTYSSHLQALDAFCAEQKDIVKKGENDLYYFEIVDDNGTITNIFAKCRTKAIEIYSQKTGCPKEYVKEHCIVRPKKMKGGAE